MKKRFAFFLMGAEYNTELHQAEFETGSGIWHIFTVKDFEEAKEKALYCLENGFGIIELCGAFGEQRANEIIDITKNKIGVGFVNHFPKQDELFSVFFSDKE